ARIQKPRRFKMANLVLSNRRPLSLFTEVDRILDSMFEDTHSFGRTGSLLARVPAVNVVETDNQYTIEAELPGFDQDQVEIKIDDGILRISSLVEESTESKDSGNGTRYLIRERTVSGFNRSFV